MCVGMFMVFRLLSILQCLSVRVPYLHNIISIHKEYIKTINPKLSNSQGQSWEVVCGFRLTRSSF